MGAFQLVSNSLWRRQRLLILCYHGTSTDDEHLWRPLFTSLHKNWTERFSALKNGKYSVQPLGTALQRLRAGTLPPRSVAITFDDGTYDFYRHAFPLLQSHGFPATVYLTTYYTFCELPVFNLICSYMLWQRRDRIISDATELGLAGAMDLRSERGRHKVVRALIEKSESELMTGLQKDGLAARLADFLGIDYTDLKARRILQLMNADEVRNVAQAGIDIQLHTHRHRLPENEELFRHEIQENRASVRELAGNEPVHFCYPGGDISGGPALATGGESNLVHNVRCCFGNPQEQSSFAASFRR